MNAPCVLKQPNRDEAMVRFAVAAGETPARMPATAPVNAETVPTADSTMTSQLQTGSLEPSRNMSRARCARKDAFLLWVGAVHPSVAPHGRRPPLHQDAPSSTTPTVSRSHPARRHRPKGSRNTSIPQLPLSVWPVLGLDVRLDDF